VADRARAASAGAGRRPTPRPGSLDGFLARPDGTLDWFLDPPGDELRLDGRRHDATLAFLGQIGLIVLGRGAFEEMAPAWSSSDSPMAVLMNTLPKVVFSRTLQTRAFHSE
jgi:dihydrofolate reductase